MNKAISVKNLTRIYEIPINQGMWSSMFFPKFKNLTAVNNVNFEVEMGESIALLGPNGAGKTTTLKMLTGLLHPTEGEIRVLGYNPGLRKEDYLRQIAMVMGNKNGLPWDLSSRHGFRLFEAIYDLDHSQVEKNVAELAEILEVENCMDRPIRKLSLGQRLKMELIGSLLHKPKVLFLDEPTLGLDIIAKKNVRDFLKKRNINEGTTIVLTSHDMADIEKVSDRVIVINEGVKVYDGQISELLNKYRQNKYMTVTFEEQIQNLDLEFEGKIIEKKMKGFVYVLEVPKKSVAKVISTLSDKYEIDDIDILQVPLEEVISDIFKGKKQF